MSTVQSLKTVTLYISGSYCEISANEMPKGLLEWLDRNDIDLHEFCTTYDQRKVPEELRPFDTGEWEENPYISIGGFLYDFSCEIVVEDYSSIDGDLFIPALEISSMEETCGPEYDGDFIVGSANYSGRVYLDEIKVQGEIDANSFELITDDICGITLVTGVNFIDKYTMKTIGLCFFDHQIDFQDYSFFVWDSNE